MTAAKRMRRADIVDLKEVQERFEEFDGVAGKGKGGLTEFRCGCLIYTFEDRQTIIYPKATYSFNII